MGIEYAKEETKQAAAGIVCPKCFKELMGYSVISNEIDRYGRELRTYLGWCVSCKLGSEVVQFRDEKWHIHKYRYCAVVIETDKSLLSGKWQIVNELPEPPAVVIGPGGQYDKPIDLNNIAILKSLHSILSTTAETLKALLKNMGGQ